MARGSLSQVRFGSDFTQLIESTVPTTTGLILGNGLSIVGVNEGAILSTVDEDGGIIDITTDTGDDDNEFLVAGTFKPSSGGMWAEARFKIPDSVATTRAAVFFGFAETLSPTTPVMPLEATGTTMTYNAGGIAGFYFDSDATALNFRFAVGDGTAALATKDKNGVVGVALGIIPAGQTMTADRWYVGRVEIGPDGIARGYWGDLAAGKELDYVGESTAALGTGDTFHAVLGIENRSAANERLEVDYFLGEGSRDWAVD